MIVPLAFAADPTKNMTYDHHRSASQRPEAKDINMGRSSSPERPKQRLMAVVITTFALFIYAWPMSSMAKDSPTQDRIVSINLCTDQLLLQLADASQIVGLSSLSNDPRSSAMWREAAGFPTTNGTAEAVIKLNPTIVFAGTYSTRATTDLLRRLGYRVETFTPAQSIEDTKANIMKMAALTNTTKRGETLIQQIDHALQLASERKGTKPNSPPTFSDYGVNGWTSGATSLLGDIATATGFSLLSEELGYIGGGYIRLEELIQNQPDYIDFIQDNAPANSLSREQFRHPIIDHVKSNVQEVDIPSRLSLCGSAAIVDVIDSLKLVRAAASTSSAP